MRSPRFSVASLVVGVCLLTACPQWSAKAQSRTLVGDCNQLAEVVNQNQGIISDFNNGISEFTQSAAQAETLSDIKSAAEQYVELVGTVISDLENLIGDLEALSLSDDQLSSYQNEYAGVIAGFNEALTLAAAAMNGVAEVETEEALPGEVEVMQSKTAQAVEQIQELSIQESDIIGGVNEHCRGGA